MYTPFFFMNKRMKKIIVLMIGMIIISTTTVFIVNELSHDHDAAIETVDYSQMLVELSENCEPLECQVISSFNRLSKSEYLDNMKEIAESVRPILTYKNGPKIGIAMLNIAFENGVFDDSEKLYFLDKIATLKYKDNDLFGMIDPILKYIQIANDRGDSFQIATGELSLALVISYFNGYEFSNEIIKPIIEHSDSEQWYRLKNQAMLSLAENNLAMDEASKALDSLNRILKYKEAYNEEDWRDYYIYTLALKAEAYTKLGQLSQAQEALSIAKHEMGKDKSQLLLGKELLISVAEFQLAFKQGDYFFIEDNKDELLDKVDKDNQRRYANIIYSTLFDYYNNSGKLIELYDINKRNYKLMTKRQCASYQLLISNKLKQNENHHLNEDHQQYLFFLKLAFFILVSISVLLLSMLIKIKYLNIETFTDPLTRCFNRRKFVLDYEKMSNHEHGFFILDIDNFKLINDGFGHDFGDEVLEKVASQIALILGKEHQYYRIGGEEFVILFQKMTPKACIELSEDIRCGIENLRWVHDINVTISGGLSFSDGEKNTYKSADKLLYQAKRSTKNVILNDKKEGV